ncbi:cyclase family protein [Acrocarpospora macrocephala]|uniref:Cyclase n=1 Tax=Acrocarpospora macrocephala TaxID=150177 RepID=A0A5M3WGF2_9ACTN|nr:cyclase family protein [Acrocarpospora macrocephala]GES07202.1 cyclase [Acrocarpospora macrocephala]
MRPAYDLLPVLDGLGLPHAWDVLDHELGSLSLLTPELRREAAALVSAGESISLDLPLGLIDPPLYGRAAHRHRHVQVGRNTYEDVIDDFNPQSGSQWDGLLHVRAREFGFFGGETSFEQAARGPGISRWARAGIVGRGVLLDIARWAEAQGSPIDPLSGHVIGDEDLRACAEQQGVELKTGDILCVRTGWVSAYRSLDAGSRASLAPRCTGLRADAAMARFLWDGQVAAVAADNPALESTPGDPAVGSLHRRLIPLLGMAVAELLDLDALAARCADLARWEFLFVAVPLPLAGGVSSPSNALAVL